MARVNEIAAQEIQNVLSKFEDLIVGIISTAEMQRILDAFQNSGDEFYKLESFGIFLEDYIIEGGEVTQSTPNTVDVTQVLISFNNFLWTAKPKPITIPTINGTYKIYFSTALGKLGCDFQLPANSIELASVVVANTIIDTITDTRGEVGGIRFKYNIIIDGGEW